MSASSSKKGSSKGFTHYFRYGVGFIERLIKNIIIQTKWVWKQSVWMFGKFTNLHTRHLGYAPHNGTKCVFGLVISIIGFFFFFLLCFWSVIKSI